LLFAIKQKKGSKMALNLDRFDKYLIEGRLIAHKFVDVDDEGRKRACWLAAMSEPVEQTESAFRCPAEDLPNWMAHLVVALDDNTAGSARWTEFAGRLSKALRVTRSEHDWALALDAMLRGLVEWASPCVARADLRAIGEELNWQRPYFMPSAAARGFRKRLDALLDPFTSAELQFRALLESSLLLDLAKALRFAVQAMNKKDGWLEMADICLKVLENA